MTEDSGVLDFQKWTSFPSLCFPFLWLWHVIFQWTYMLPWPKNKNVKDTILLAATSVFHIYPWLFISSVTNSAWTKPGDMGGTEQDSQCTIKGRLMQMDTQVVQPFFLHVARTSRNKAGKYTFLYSTIVCWSNLKFKHTVHKLHKLGVFSGSL